MSDLIKVYNILYIKCISSKIFTENLIFHLFWIGINNFLNVILVRLIK